MSSVSCWAQRQGGERAQGGKGGWGRVAWAHSPAAAWRTPHFAHLPGLAWCLYHEEAPTQGHSPKESLEWHLEARLPTGRVRAQLRSPFPEGLFLGCGILGVLLGGPRDGLKARGHASDLLGSAFFNT